MPAAKTKTPAARKRATPKRKKAKTITPRHQWTHDGAEVLILKCVAKDGSSYGGFKWPLTVGAPVVAPDWNPVATCGGGLHGWPWGFSIGDGKTPDWQGVWLVFGAAPADVIDLDGKVKCRAVVIRYVGDWAGATAFVLSGQMAWVAHAADGASSATGDSGASSATGNRGASSATGTSGASSATGYSGASSATGTSGASSATGNRGASSATGNRGASSATGTSGASSATGYSGASSATGTSGASSATGNRGASSATGTSGASSATGNRGASSATGDSGASSATGYSGASSATGDASAAVATGLDSRVRGGKFGAVALAWWNREARRSEMRAAEIGVGDGSDGKLKANVWYRLNAAGAFIQE